ncbi:hypothetical protein HDF23_001822 [Mucilaginibacter lappiensis]|uniref:Uncharacterized protein n=1 Tax=Mucilaginibacter lappiensis TaxID=354630 RepID=A0ABR6PIP0_9SPHI|nr:hypothetical protein [Mucilaginibacter lappiensis]
MQLFYKEYLNGEYYKYYSGTDYREFTPFDEARGITCLFYFVSVKAPE